MSSDDSAEDKQATSTGALKKLLAGHQRAAAAPAEIKSEVDEFAVADLTERTRPAPGNK